MASEAVQAIIDESQCQFCVGSSLFETMEIGLLMRISTMTQQEIMAEVSCFTCLGMSLPQAAILVLLNSILTSGGGGGGGGGSATAGCGVVNPEGVVVANQCALYYNTANDTFWVKRVGSGNSAGWSQLV